jgi:hypothetical protein
MPAIPRGQVLLPAGSAEPDATEFAVRAELGSEVYGILSNPFLDRSFQTAGFHMRVTVNDDGTWSREEHTEIRIPDRDGVVDHVDRNMLKRIGEPMPNPLAMSRIVTLRNDELRHRLSTLSLAPGPAATLSRDPTRARVIRDCPIGRATARRRASMVSTTTPPVLTAALVRSNAFLGGDLRPWPLVVPAPTLMVQGREGTDGWVLFWGLRTRRSPRAVSPRSLSIVSDREALSE